MEGIKHDKMKYRLAEAMKNCMKKMPVEKITVKELWQNVEQRGRHFTEISRINTISLTGILTGSC